MNRYRPLVALSVAGIFSAGTYYFWNLDNNGKKQEYLRNKTGLKVSPLPEDMSPFDPQDPKVQLALRLRQEGAILYSTDWCHPCDRQKDSFGEAKALLPNVDCSRLDGVRGFNPECFKVGIRTVPAWKRADGSFVSGEENLERLERSVLSSTSNLFKLN
eukprot:CFRG3056T1